jgi:hypothetical protein
MINHMLNPFQPDRSAIRTLPHGQKILRKFHGDSLAKNRGTAVSYLMPHLPRFFPPSPACGRGLGRGKLRVGLSLQHPLPPCSCAQAVRPSGIWGRGVKAAALMDNPGLIQRMAARAASAKKPEREAPCAFA